jgi:drug/metabolite transporter (DMT)-like permease
MALIIAGAIIISFEIDEENKFSLRKKTVFLMTLASLLSALDSVIFKFVLIQENIWQSLFWENIGLGIFGISIFIFANRYRKDFLLMVKENSKKIFSLNVLNEVLYIAGNFLFAFAYLLAPVALVLLVNSYQPIIVFAIGIFLTLFFPKLGTESIKLKHISQKLIALAIIGIGTYLLFK